MCLATRDRASEPVLECRSRAGAGARGHSRGHGWQDRAENAHVNRAPNGWRILLISADLVDVDWIVRGLDGGCGCGYGWAQTSGLSV